MSSTEEKLRVSLLAQESLRQVLDQQAVELCDLRDFSEAERGAMIDEKKAVLDEAKRQVDGVQALIQGLQKEKTVMKEQIQFLESALESAASDRACFEAAAQSSGAAKSQENENLQREIDTLKENIMSVHNELVIAKSSSSGGSSCGTSITDSTPVKDRQALREAARQVAVMDAVIM